jgi:hypothetical protein
VGICILFAWIFGIPFVPQITYAADEPEQAAGLGDGGADVDLELRLVSRLDRSRKSKTLSRKERKLSGKSEYSLTLDMTDDNVVTLLWRNFLRRSRLIGRRTQPSSKPF